MEEQVGRLWHRLITRAARTGYPHAAVTLEQVRRPVAMLFHALGGPGGLRIKAAEATAYGARRGWLQRLAGSGRRVALAWRDEASLRLPPRIDHFAEPALNRDLYLWLAALAAFSDTASRDWFVDSQAATARILEQYPGLRARYRRLVQAHVVQRPDPAGLPAHEAAREQAVRQALMAPGQVERLPTAPGLPYPVVLWLHPVPPTVAEGGQTADEDADAAAAETSGEAAAAQTPRRRAERVDMPERDRGLLAIRFETLFSKAEFVRVDRGQDDNDDLEAAARDLEDLDLVTVARERRRTAGRLRVDLDLPAAAHDDLVLADGIRLPEWDYRRQRLVPDHCALQLMLAADAEPCAVPDRLKVTARRLRAQFQALAPARRWLRGQSDGAEIDMDAALRFAVERHAGGALDSGLYRDLRQAERGLACLLLADLSLSTDAWINNERRVIDVIRDSLFLFSESLAAVGDPFALYGFSSRKRNHVRFHLLKTFAEAYGGAVRGRISAIRPGYYTRMGAAIRQASRVLAGQPAERRLLLLLTDGKPNDLDLYEGRYGIEDTRHAVREAREQGLECFCVTIDERAGDYLPHLFGANGFVVIRRPSELPRQLPRLYARLTR